MYGTFNRVNRVHGKEYIPSETVHFANSEPKLSLIVFLFDTFCPACLLDFQKQIHPARLFHPIWLINFSKISNLLVYSIVLFHSILESIENIYFVCFVLLPISHLAWADFRIKVKRIAHSIVHFDQWNKLISKM